MTCVTRGTTDVSQTIVFCKFEQITICHNRKNCTASNCLKRFSILAQYVNCAAANPGADAGMYDASEQYKLSTWQQVPHREIRFVTKVVFVDKDKSGSCS